MFKKIVAAAALAAIASSSFAGTPGTLYGGLDVGQTKVEDFSAKKTSFGGFVGYNFHQNFALEGGFRRLGEYDLGAGEERTFDQTALSVVGSVPLRQDFSVFGRLGYNYIKADSRFGDDSESRVLYGVGLGYNFSPTVVGRVEVQKPTSDSTNVGVAVAFQF